MKELADELAMPLSIIYTKSLNEGELPQIWKDTIITPLHYRPNYRPISLTSIICKIMESILKDLIMNYLNENGLLTHHQYGFVSGKSCQSNLLKMLNHITKALENGTEVDTVYLDFAKAFDSVPHRRLI